jgi:hypothetical protein
VNSVLHLFDPSTGDECTPYSSPEGGYACVSKARVEFADAACTIPIAVVDTSGVECTSDAPPKHAFLTTYDSCSAPNTLTPFEVGAEITASVRTTYAVMGGKCLRSGPVSANRVFEARPTSAAGMLTFQEQTE